MFAYGLSKMNLWQVWLIGYLYYPYLVSFIVVKNTIFKYYTTLKPFDLFLHNCSKIQSFIVWFLVFSIIVKKKS